MKASKNLLILFILGLVLLTSCSNPTSSAPKLPIVPRFGFSEGSARVLNSSDVSMGEQLVTMFTPLLLGFSENVNGVTSDAVLDYSIMGSKLSVVTVYEPGSDLITMNGEFEDRSGFVKLTMDMEHNVYNYEQLMVIKDSQDPINLPENPIVNGQAAIYFSFSDVPLNSSGDYHKYIEGCYFLDGDLSLMELDYFGGTDDNGDKVGGVFIHRFLSPENQPDLSAHPDFYDLTASDILQYYTDTADWQDTLVYNSLFFYYNYSDDKIYTKESWADTFEISGVAEQPWTVLPKP